MTPADSDAQEWRDARDRNANAEHPPTCLCRERCLVEQWDPAEEAR